MATTPHSSWNLSNMRFECLIVWRFEMVNCPPAEQVPLLQDLDLSLDGHPYSGRFDIVARSDLGDLFGMGSRNQHARGSFMKQQQVGTNIGMQIDAGANASRAERTFSESYRQPSIAQIMRGFHNTFVHDFANRVLDTLLTFQIQRGRQTPELVHDDFGVLRAAEPGFVA